MSSQSRDRVSALYHAALARAPEARNVFLQQACDGDESLRQEVESLLGYESRESRALSPDGRWMAYTSDEAGKGRDVYVAPFPGPGAVHLVSEGGGHAAMWSKDGKELFYFRPNGTLMSAAVETGRAFKPGVPRKLFTVPVGLTVGWGNEYAVSSDGNRFLVNVLSRPKPITVVLDWLALTKR